MPIHVSTAILNYAKLRMLQFYYDFLDKYVSRADFQLMYMDTDSSYMAISADKLEDIIKPEMKNEYEKDKNNWLPRTDTEANNKYDQRTPGLFKVEYEGNGIVCLCPKLYYCLNDGKQKFSSKGVQKTNTNILNFESYKNVLLNDSVEKATNTGMRYLNGSIVRYQTTKIGLTNKYNKRKTMEDKVTTCPLDDSYILE